MPLSDAKIRRTKAGATPVRLSDGDGLYLLVQPSGSALWRFDYILQGRRNTLSLGAYPEVSLTLARQRRAEARAKVAAGIDPSRERQAAREAATQAMTFGEVADEWLERQRHVLAPITFEKASWMLKTLVSPWLGKRPVAEIEPPELLQVLRQIEARGKHETAHRTKQRCGQVFRYAIATGRTQRDPSSDLRGALTPVRHQHRAAITDPARVGELLRAIDAFEGTFVVGCALKLAPLLFVRPGELRRAEWSEIDLGQAEWRIPAEKTKMREAHLVPLSTQAVAILALLKPLTGTSRYVFPSIRTRHQVMSENTINVALKRLGYDASQMCGHGFRALASTLLNEMGWAPDIIERQLAHAPRNKVRAAYNRAQHLAERRKMMQAWADFLDGLRRKGEVVPQHRSGGRDADH
ncbi:tyrosine-type recombinase/integrase [Luteitalea pratensis]|uniref:tyrosine-type recombinase/integrase n=1 Tax=Luteitalea pratensis TaxID=1855912 RepID=UPI001F21A0BB|nr:integrase arm-type DNA-binding domain-containing protein [Luteitalea pratensis]